MSTVNRYKSFNFFFSGFWIGFVKYWPRDLQTASGGLNCSRKWSRIVVSYLVNWSPDCLINKMKHPADTLRRYWLFVYVTKWSLWVIVTKRLVKCHCRKKPCCPCGLSQKILLHPCDATYSISTHESIFTASLFFRFGKL